MLLALMLVIAFPCLATWLPNALIGAAAR
jgi:hypothetical protein